MATHFYRSGERISVIKEYDPKDITVKVNPKKEIEISIGKETHNIRISLPGCGLYTLSKPKTRKKAEEKVKEFDEKLKKGCLVTIIDGYNAEIK